MQAALRCSVAGATGGRSSLPCASSFRKPREVGVGRRLHVDAVAREVRAELQQIGPVGLERVARQPALELQVREEVEHVMLERTRGRGSGDGRHAEAFFLGPPAPAVAIRLSAQEAQTQQRLRVLCCSDRTVQVGKRPADDFDPLVLP